MRNILFLITAALLTSCATNGDRLPCQTQSDCQDDPNCECWCSQICKYRKKKADDHPFYVDNDPNEKFCYCKQWDYDFYNDNCIEGKKIKEPPGAQ